MSEKIKISLIKKVGGIQEPLEKEIIDSINSYLIRNKGAVSDFNLIRDITERSIDTVEEDVSSMVPIPLYLGLAGTMLGIIIGLFYLPSLETGDNFEKAIDSLIKGVQIAMFASFTGLLLTLIHSGFLFKRAKSRTEKTKNDFYTFVQTELLPVVSQNLSTSIHSLQNNLVKFNKTFDQNIDRFDDVLIRIKDIYKEQGQMMKEIKEMDMVTMASFNKDVLSEVRSSIGQFNGFNERLSQLNEYLQLINSFVSNAQNLNSSISSQLSRTIQIEEIAKTIKENSVTNKELTLWLNDGRKEIEFRADTYRDSTVEVERVLKAITDQFNDSIRNVINSLTNLATEEERLLNNFFNSKKDNFDELKHLSSMNEGISSLSSELRNQANSIKTLSKEIKEISSNKAEKSSGNVEFKIPFLMKVSLFFITCASVIVAAYILYKIAIRYFL